MEELLSQVQSGVASHRAHSDWTEAAAVGWREKQAWLLWPWLMNESSDVVNDDAPIRPSRPGL